MKSYILLALVCVLSLSTVSAADYNFYLCADNSSLGTSYNITFSQAGSNADICVNSSGVSSTNVAVKVGGDATWRPNSTIASGLGNFGPESTPSVFQKDSTWYLIAGRQVGDFKGFNWTGSTWQSDTVIASGLGDIGSASTPFVFQKDSTWYLISGEYGGAFYGFNWTGSTWQSDTVIASGLGDAGTLPTPSVFQKDSTWYLISGRDDGAFYGFNWTGSTWQSDTAIASGLGDIGSLAAPFVFQKDSTWYLISGRDSGTFYGFNWTGSTWQPYTSVPGEGIAEGLTDVGDSSVPSVFQKDSTWYLISGDAIGGFSGWDRVDAPTNLSLDLLNDSTNEWSMTGELTSTNPPQWTTGVPAGTFTAGGMIILNWTSDTVGVLELSDINWGPWITVTSPGSGFVTQNTTVVLNATVSDPDNTSFNFYYYNASDFVALAGGNYTWNVSSVVDGTISWRVQVDDGFQNSSFAANSTINILFAPDACVVGTNNDLTILSFYLIDEENLNNMTSGFIGAVLTITHNGTDYEYSVSNSSNQLDVCVDSVYQGDLVDVDTTFHNGTVWPLGSWFIRDQVINSTTVSQALALLNTTFTTVSDVYVVDAMGTQAQDYFVTLLRYDYDNSQWQTLRMSKTDLKGKAVFYLRRNDVYYSFYVYDSTMSFVQTFSNYIISSLETTLQIDISAFSEVSAALTNVDYSCTSSNTSVNCTTTDNNSPLRVVKTTLRTKTGGAVNFTSDCEATDTTNPATVSCVMDPNELYFYVLLVDMGSSTVPLTSGFVGSFPQDDYGAIGIFALAFLALGCAFVGSYNPQMFVLLLFVGFALGTVMGLASFTDGMTFSLFATLSMIVIWRLKPK